MKNWWYYVIVLFAMVLTLFFVRLILPSQLDDVSPGIFCEEKLMNLADVYYVIPKYENVSIDEEWCNEISQRSKTLAIHGVYHTFEEFGVVRDSEYLNEGIEIFEECFGFSPEKFKPPQLAWTNKNNWMKDYFEINLFWNQFFHKVYHCEDTGIFPNWVVRVS